MNGVPAGASGQPGPETTGRRDRLTRAASDDPETAILELLRIPFADPSDPDLARRRQLLAGQFERIDPSRASALHGLLARRTASDELSRRFWALSRQSRRQMLTILKRKQAQHRQTIRPASSPVVRGIEFYTDEVRQVRRNPRYVENMPLRELWGWLPGYYFVHGKDQHVEVLYDQVVRRPVQISTDYSRIYKNRDVAFRAVQAWYNASPEYAGSNVHRVAYYLDPNNVIVPTSFTPETTPRLSHEIALAEASHKFDPEAYQKGGRYLMGVLRDWLNPSPFGSSESESADPQVLQALPRIPGRPRGIPRLPRAGTQGWGASLPPTLRTALHGLVQEDRRAAAAVDRLAKRGNQRMLEAIADEYASVPAPIREQARRDGRKLLRELGTLPDRRLDGLEAARSALAETGVGKRAPSGATMELDWLDLWSKLPQRFRNELLDLIGDVAPVIDGGLAKAIQMAMRESGQSLQGGLGHFSAAAHLKATMLPVYPGLRMRFEVPTIVTVGPRNLPREVDIQVRIGQRTIDVEVKTHLEAVGLPAQVRQEFVKDIVQHTRDRWENLRYLYSPNVRGQLETVRTALRETLSDPAVRSALAREKLTLAEARRLLDRRLASDLVAVYEWVLGKR